MKHVSVLLKESLDALNVQPGKVIVDATLGGGGHALEVAKCLGSKGRLIAFDLDESAIKQAQDYFQASGEKNLPSTIWIKKNFVGIKEELEARGIEKVDGILADLGWRIEQVKNDSYGLSFESEKLDMRLNSQGEIFNDQAKIKKVLDNKNQEEKVRKSEEQMRLTAQLTAYEIVNFWQEKELREIFLFLGEEKEATRIARAIVKERQEKPVESARELSNLIAQVKPRRGQKNHPATKVFQALRMVVNQELSNLESFLQASWRVLAPGGRLVIISFHSLEDSLVKKHFRAWSQGCECPKEVPICVCGKELEGKLIKRKPIKPSEEELIDNPRSRSARLRVIEKVKKF
jgi:16S rRNA (cytosine1402-N4)-methyltransferase